MTDDEKELALKEAMVKKHASLENDRKKRLAEEKRKEFFNQVSHPNELYKLARYRGTLMIRFRSGDPAVEFEPTEFQKPVITALSLYFTGAAEFEQLDTSKYNSLGIPFSLNKGLWIWGNPGVGKSLMMEMFNRNTRLCYELVQCPKLCYEYVKNGDDVLERYVTITPAIPCGSNFGQRQMGICYNDLGTENLQSKHYGNPINVMEHIILQSYENKVPYHHRHITTNLTFDQVKDAYGLRVLDRIKECYNIIEVRGESLRGKTS